ncbi:MAG TPA: amidohydrolase [Burkholderiaceae bacterium]|nr:amidohydrolase [Burkholderiaceae bacterium]HNB43618.1 amidohydrolase [Burkholderiaceae bacterium]
MSTTVYAARKILTMNPRQPAATHIAVRDGRVLAVGDLERMKAWGHFELDERFADKVLMPGLVEGHCHLKEGGMWDWPYLGWFDRRGPGGRLWPGLRSMAAVVARLAEIDQQMHNEGRPADAPLIAWGFDPIYFGSERMTVEHLDRASATRPIVVGHANGHLMSVNSAMLRLAGIDRETDVEGVMKFANGEPNGELQEPAAMFLVQRRVGQAGLLAPMDDAGMQGFASIACAQGVTTATDLVNRLGAEDRAVLERACGDDAWRVRIVPAFQAFHGTHRAAEGAEYLRELMKRNTERLRYGLVKMLLDGSIQGFSARLRWPGYFNGAPNGIWVTAPAQYEADFEVYHRAGLSIHTHTNGDEASEVAIDAIERVLTRAPRPDHRHTLQHGQMIDAAMFRRMAALGLAVNLFANHVWYWGDQHRALTMGPDRAERLDACRSALDAGVALAIHSDAPVTPLSPLFTAWCAVNRLTPSGRVLGAAERITVPEALHAITLGAAWTLKLDHEIGSLECGKRADFCVLEDDPLAVDALQLKDLRVWGTVLGGRVFPADAA